MQGFAPHPTSFADRHLLGIGIKEAKELHFIKYSFIYNKI
ncbi:hypothetical protein BP951000_0630 [Brachyspira pilosicoli 95/1000]|uniref:Uncharacterized protein n=1 Tax=Brachyspira pilosicoli (strain ATCC BAA-1826 / 95/1000) TaxID=759914 RepID=D8IBV6_BRAP9|nr:hypothetical protein BP951000_0630 [Brachyspira pilosicoli 95/1000]